MKSPWRAASTDEGGGAQAPQGNPHVLRGEEGMCRCSWWKAEQWQNIWGIPSPDRLINKPGGEDTGQSRLNNEGGAGSWRVLYF